MTLQTSVAWGAAAISDAIEREERAPASPGALPLACVIGDLSLVRTLGRAGVPVAVATSDPTASAARSRYCAAVVTTPDFVERPEEAVGALLAWARRQAAPPVIYCQGDHDLLAVSRGREALADHARLIMPEAELVEDLVDKARFARLAEQRGLPVPLTRVLPRDDVAGAVEGWDRFPCVVKPALRTRWYGSAVQIMGDGEGSHQKALRIESRAELERLVPTLARHETDLVLQASIEGGEDLIASYHAYVRDGEVVGEFTGRKLRTAPRRHGLSSYVVITDDRELREVGRAVLAAIGFSGVAKLDFKRDQERGRLHLLEVNPRFNLWHRPGALAGVNLPALVYQDCLEPGTARASGPGRAGVRWIASRKDLSCLPEHRRAGELSTAGWIAQVLTADADEDLDLRDPWPVLCELGARLTRRIRRSLPAGRWREGNAA